MRVDSLAEIRRKAMTQRLKEIYKQAGKDLDTYISRYFNGWDEDGIHHAGFHERKMLEMDKFEKGLYDVEYLINKAKEKGVDLEKMWYWKKYQEGTLTAEDFFDRWEMAQEMRGQYWIETRDKMAVRLTEANKTAVKYMNGETPNIYVKASHEVAEMCYKTMKEQGVSGIKFNMVDEYKLKAVMDQGGKIPYKKLGIKEAKDVAFNERKIQDILYRGVLQGKSAEAIAKDFEIALNICRSSAVRMAKFAVTNVKEAGKQHRLEDLWNQGVYSEKQWIDVHDSMPPERQAHWNASGQIVPTNKPFYVGGEYLMQPGDPTGSGWNIENCRCRMEPRGFAFRSILDDDTRKKANIKIVSGGSYRNFYGDDSLPF